MIELHREVPIPMRDGTVLRAEVWRDPSRASGPAVLVRTPYLKETAPGPPHIDVRAAADRGYAVVIQDVRGRGTSEGTFHPFVQERADGQDTVEWVTRQPWCDGQVVMLGMSYVGATQWLAASTLPSGLVAIAPTLSSPEYGEGWSRTADVSELGFLASWNAGDLAPTAYWWNDEPLRGYTDHNGLFDIAPWTREWLTEPAESPYWTERSMRDGAVRQAVPAFITAGWYDVFCTAAIRSFAAGVNPDDRLVIGPWGHDGAMSHLVGDASVGWAGNGAAWGWADRVFDFFDAVRAGRPVPGPRVAAYILGAKRWLEAPTWPPPQSTVESWTLATGEFTVDTEDLAPALGGRNLLVKTPGSGWGIRDQRQLAERADVVTVLDQPIEQPTLLIGPATVDLRVAAKGGETRQWVAVLCLSRTDGSLHNLTEGVANAPTSADRVLVELGHLGVECQPGERLVLLVTGSASPRWAPPAEGGRQSVLPGSELQLTVG